MSWKSGLLDEELRFLLMVRSTSSQTEMLMSSFRTPPGENVAAEKVAGDFSAWCSEIGDIPAPLSLLTIPTSWKALGALDLPGMIDPQSAGTYVIETDREAAMVPKDAIHRIL
jgi:hypothetical protein